LAETIKGINVVIGSDTTALTKALGDVNKKSRDIATELKAVEKLLKLDPGNTELLAQKQKLLADAVANTSTKLSSLKTAQEQVNEQFAKGEISEGQYRAFQREIAKTEQELQGFEGKLSSTGAQLDTFADKTQRAGEKISSVGEGMKNTGEKMTRTLGPAALAIGGALGVAVKSAADFDTSMRKAGAIAGATTLEFEAMRASALDLGATTSLSASEVAEAMTEMAAKGFTANQTIAAMPGVISAAEASGESLALAADTVATALNIWGLEASESSRVADVLAMSANESAAGIDDLGQVMKYAGGPAATLGISLEELAAAAGIMANAGLDGSNAGTALRASLLALLSPAKEQGAMMEAMGFSMIDSAGNAKSLSEIIRDMTKATEGMTDADKAATLSKLVGREAVSGFLSLMKSGSAEIDKMTTSLKNSGGASAEAAAKMKAGIGGALENLSGAIDSFVITVGDQLVPIVQQTAGWITELVNKFTALPEPIQQFLVVGLAIVGVLAAVGAVIGIVLIAVGSMMTAIGPLITAIGAAGGATAILGTVFAALTGPIAIVIASIAALVAGLIYLYNNNETVKNAIIKAWEFIKTSAGVIFNAISAAIKFIFDGLKAFWDKWGLTITEMFTNLFEILKIAFKFVFDVIFTIVKTIFNNLKAFWDMWGTTITGVFKTVFEVVKTVFQGAWNNIKIIVETVIGVISGIIKTWLALFKGDWAGAWDSAKETVGAVWDGITGIFSNSFKTMAEVGKNIIKGLINGIKSMKDAVVNTAKDVASSIGNSIKDFFTIKSPSRLMIGYGKNIVQGLANGMEDTGQKAVNSALSVANAVAGAMNPNVGNVANSQAGISSSTSGNSSVINMDGMLSGANFYVRNDNDSKQIAKELWAMAQQTNRGTGGARA